MHRKNIIPNIATTRSIADQHDQLIGLEISVILLVTTNMYIILFVTTNVCIIYIIRHQQHVYYITRHQQHDCDRICAIITSQAFTSAITTKYSPFHQLLREKSLAQVHIAHCQTHKTEQTVS